LIPALQTYPEVTRLIALLGENIHSVLGSRLVGLYLEGSLATGTFDAASDIDFVAVTADEIDPDLFLALRSMHDQLAGADPVWGIQLEGFYISRHAVRRYDPPHPPLPNLERGEGERLKPVPHDENWAIHRYLLREHSIALTGPDPKTLIDPVHPDLLRQAARAMLSGWGAQLLANPAKISHRGYQYYIILTLSRILYTLERGEIASKPTAAQWAQENLPTPWSALVGWAWAGRIGNDQEQPPEDLRPTLAFIRYVGEHS
jgi:hypothetical protein